MNPKLRKVSQENENLFTSIDCNNHMDNCPMKHVNSNTRRVDFREDEVHNEPSIEQVLSYYLFHSREMILNMTFSFFFFFFLNRNKRRTDILKI